MLGAVALARRTKKQKFSEQAAGGSSRSSSQPYHARNTASLAISISFQRGRSRHVAMGKGKSSLLLHLLCLGPQRSCVQCKGRRRH